MLQDYSFSIYYRIKDGRTETLDLTCKDEREFDLWVIGIKALYSHFSSRVICKNELLNHSKSYQEQLSKGNIGNCTKFLFYNNEKNAQKKNLENFIISRNMPLFDTAKLCLRLLLRVRDLKGDVETLSNTDEYKTGHKEEGYDMIFAEEAIVDDLDTQKGQMMSLFKECESNIGIVINEFVWYTKEYQFNSDFKIDESDIDEFMKIIHELALHLQTYLHVTDLDTNKIDSKHFIKELDIKLWKIEIDLENVGDIVNRFKSSNDIGFLEKLKDMFNIFK
jgi:hypothetical protein